MRPQAKELLSHLVTVVSIAVLILVAILLLAQNRKLSAGNQTLIQEIKEQSLTNQRYVRCILLIPQEQYRVIAERVKAIDKCAIESVLPSGQPSGDPQQGDIR